MTARGYWEQWPVDEPTGREPALNDGDEHWVKLVDGEVVEAVYVVRSGAGGGRYFTVDEEPVEVLAVWHGEGKPKAPGRSLTDAERQASGKVRLQGLHLPGELVARLDAHAARERLSRTSIVQAALDEWLPSNAANERCPACGCIFTPGPDNRCTSCAAEL